MTTFIAMLLPYFGDFVPLAGAISVFPLIFAATLAMTALVGYHLTPPPHPSVNGLD